MCQVGGLSDADGWIVKASIARSARIGVNLNAHTMVLADPRLEQLEAEMHECPICYYKTREPRAIAGVAWPRRIRYENKLEKPCVGCGRPTIWCSAGEWRPGPSAKKVSL